MRDNATMTTSVRFKHLLYICMATPYWKSRFQKFPSFFKCEEGYPSNIQGVHMNDIPNVENSLQFIFFLWGIDFVDGKIIGGLALRSFQKCNCVKRWPYNNHVCGVNNINSLFQAFRCSTCDTFFSKIGALEQKLFFAVNASNISTQRTFTTLEKISLTN